MKISVDHSKTFQTIESFGASGAWWSQMVGGWDHIDEKSGMPANKRIMQLLYSKDEGIGINCYRYNLGGGSVESELCNLGNKLREAECFEASEGVYDWNKDANAVKIMRYAVEFGADEVIFFVNSPICRLTKNKKAFLDNDKAWHENIDESDYKEFADYVLDVTEHFVEEGIPVKYISPVNEPLWVWTEKHGQEGCHYNPSSVRKVLRCFAAEIERRNILRGVMLSGCENGDIRWFNKTYTRAVLDDKIIRQRTDSIDVHSYFITPDFLKPFIGNRLAFLRRYKKWMDKKYPGVSIKVSEWTHMQSGRDYGMNSALVQAKTMFEDLTILNAASWQHWIAVSEVDFCDGLIYVDKDKKTFELTKRYYAFGNFSKFIKRGSRRIDVNCDSDKVCCAAFDNGENTVIILINENTEFFHIDFDCFKTAEMYITSDEKNLEKQNISGSTTIPPRSVCTIIYGDKI